MEKKQKTRIGRVISHKMDKTAIVAVDTIKLFPLYRKALKRTEKVKAHDEKNEAKPGDVVRIVETRPLSKDKRWRIAEIVTKGEVAEVKPEEIT